MATTHPLRWLVVLGTLLPLLTLSAGCGNTKVAMPGEKDLADLKAGRRSLVLLRGVAETPKGRLRTAFGPGAWRGSRDLCVARLDGEKQLRSVGRLPSPTKAALRDGWVYLMLKPGTYYLSADSTPYEPAPAVAVAPGPRPGDAESFGWLLDVPGNAPVVYAGTLSFVDMVVSDLGNEWHPGEGRRARIRDESSRAFAFASDHFPNLSRPRASVLHAYLGPVDPTVAAGLTGWTCAWVARTRWRALTFTARWCRTPPVPGSKRSQ